MLGARLLTLMSVLMTINPFFAEELQSSPGAWHVNQVVPDVTSGLRPPWWTTDVGSVGQMGHAAASEGFSPTFFVDGAGADIGHGGRISICVPGLHRRWRDCGAGRRPRLDASVRQGRRDARYPQRARRTSRIPWDAPRRLLDARYLHDLRACI